LQIENYILKIAFAIAFEPSVFLETLFDKSISMKLKLKLKPKPKPKLKILKSLIFNLQSI